MAKKSKAPIPFAGRWRIVSMSVWEQDFVDEEEEGDIEFAGKGQGEFHFGYVLGHRDCRLTTKTASQRSNGPGMATTRWRRLKGEAGRSSKVMNSTGRSSFIRETIQSSRPRRKEMPHEPRLSP
jgi:hypothetical protein